MMSPKPQPFPPLFDMAITAEESGSDAGLADDKQDVMIVLLRQLVIGQERQSQLLEELIQHVSAPQRQRASDLGQWKASNPSLARKCKVAAESLGRVQNEFLHQLTGEVADNEDGLLDGEFVLNEFVDRYGPRLAHLNGVLQALSQLSSTADCANSPRQ
jgi:hypothetical protein